MAEPLNFDFTPWDENMEYEQIGLEQFGYDVLAAEEANMIEDLEYRTTIMPVVYIPGVGQLQVVWLQEEGGGNYGQV